MALLNMPRAMTIKFSGAWLMNNQIEHPTTGEMVNNPISKWAGMELKLNAGINNVHDDVALYPPLRRFVVDPKAPEAAPVAPQVPAVATEPVAQNHVALAAAAANTERGGEANRSATGEDDGASSKKK